jgi:hypothetical protein
MNNQPEVDRNGVIQDKNLFIDHRLESYASFYDHEWAKRFSALTGGTKLDDIAFDLGIDWKGAANTFRMPWLLIHSLKDFNHGYKVGGQSRATVYFKALRQLVLARTARLLSNMKQRELTGIFDQSCGGVLEHANQVTEELVPEEVWSEYLKIGEFVLALWSSQRICYGSLYYAYESFLRRCAAVGNPPADNEYTGIGALKDDLNRLIGSDMADVCLDDPKVVLAQLVRNSLVHNGGRVTPKIRSRQHGLKVADGLIHIMAPDVRDLFDLLKEKVLVLVETALARPEYGQRK